MKTIVIATKNAEKAREYQDMLAPLGIEVKMLADFAPIAINENGKTFEENATVKATTAANQLQLPFVADGSGLMVDALGGASGVYSARYAGDHDDAANNAKLLLALKETPDEKRTAHFHTTIVGIKPDETKLVANGRVNGHILHQFTGENGSGYNPPFYVDELGRSMARLIADQKNQISYRGHALRSFMKQFND